jgi:hypothetical protein
MRSLNNIAMEKLVSCCGLDCATCDARVATIRNDDNLRIATAEKWRKLYHSAEIFPDTINCLGCLEEGVKFNHCAVCKIRNCANSRGYDNCGECNEMGTCVIVAEIHRYSPEAILNLRSLS